MHGIYPYLPTPVTAHGEINVEALHELVHRLIDAGVHGLSPLGSTGEIMYLSPAQRETVVAETVAAAAGRVPVVPGIAAFSTADASDQARMVRDCGAQGVVVMQQLYNPLTESEQESYFRSVVKSTELPVVLYTNPKLGDVLSVDTIVRLAEEPTVRYLKDATGRTGRILSITNRCDISVFAASAHIPATVFDLGGVGWMGGPCCIAPEASVALWEARNDRAQLWAIQRALWPLNELFTGHNMAAFIKAILTHQGIDMGAPLPPQRPVDPSVIAAYDDAIAKVRGVLSR